MKRIHPEDPRVTQHALGELSFSEATEVDKAALLDPAVQEAIDETRQLAGLLDGVMGQVQLGLGEDRLVAIRRAGRAPNVTDLSSASPRRRWGRAVLISSAAAGLMLATIFVLKGIPVDKTGGRLTDGGQGVFEEETVMRLLLAPAPHPEQVGHMAQGTPVAPNVPPVVPGRENDEEWMAEYRALTQLLHEDPDRFFQNVERVARGAEIGDIAKLPSFKDNEFVDSKETSRSPVPVVSGMASYAMVERFVRGEGILPPRNAVRVEELMNSISYESGGDSELGGVRLGVELVNCPWDSGKLLLGVLLQNGSEEMIPSTASLQLVVKPELVKSYRLVGYAGVDSNDEWKDRPAAVDAGLAPGRSNFVIYELLPTDKDLAERWVMTKVEFVFGEGPKKYMTVPVMSPPRAWNSASDNFQTAAVLAGYGLLLRDSEHKGALASHSLTKLAEKALSSQRNGDLQRREALQLVIDSWKLLEER
jgi:hypothetical protein